MAKKLVLAAIALVVAFFGYVATRNGQFHYERSGVINAPAEKIFPYVSDYKKCAVWNPFDKKDPEMNRVYSGPEGQVGSVMEFKGNREAGEGRLEIVRMVPNQLVELKLTMTAPFRADNVVRYQLAPEGTATRFTWSMEGDSGYLGKLMSVFIDCEKMVGGEFEKGVASLKSLMEK
jgi:hypothetical protein